jgi:hypothetical protein
MKLNMNIERQITEGRKGGLEHAEASAEELQFLAK